MPRPLDLRFLDEPFVSAHESPAPVNVFTVAGFPRRETVASNVLAFLLDPNERHGFGTTFVDALLTLLDHATTATGDAFDPDERRGSSEWAVATEASTDDRTRIDILLENDDLDVAIVIENKVDAVIANPFGSYVAHASRSHGTVFATVLAPTRRDLVGVAPAGVRAITYDDLFDAADAALYDAGPMADPRSLALYEQFRETTSERIATMSIKQEQQRLDELWSAIEHRQEQVLDFFEAVESVNVVLAARAARLQHAISAQFDELGVPHSTWIANAGDHSWGRKHGQRVLTFVGFEPESGGGIELLVGWLPRTSTFGYTVKAWQTRNRPPRPWDHIPLGLPIDADEDAVATRFVELAQRWLAGEHPA